MLQDSLIDYVQSGVAIMAGIRSHDLRVRATRAYGIFVHEDKCELTFFLNKLAFPQFEEDLRTYGDIALGLARPSDYRAIQIKGKYLAHRDADLREKLLIDRYVKLFAEQVTIAGAQYDVYMTLPGWPGVAVTMSIESLYNQTPGPVAGEVLR